MEKKYLLSLLFLTFWGYEAGAFSNKYRCIKISFDLTFNNNTVYKLFTFANQKKQTAVALRDIAQKWNSMKNPGTERDFIGLFSKVPLMAIKSSQYLSKSDIPAQKNGKGSLGIVLGWDGKAYMGVLNEFDLDLTVIDGFRIVKTLVVAYVVNDYELKSPYVISQNFDKYGGFTSMLSSGYEIKMNSNGNLFISLGHERKIMVSDRKELDIWNGDKLTRSDDGLILLVTKSGDVIEVNEPRVLDTAKIIRTKIHRDKGHLVELNTGHIFDFDPEAGNVLIEFKGEVRIMASDQPAFYLEGGTWLKRGGASGYYLDRANGTRLDL